MLLGVVLLVVVIFVIVWYLPFVNQKLLHFFD